MTEPEGKLETLPLSVVRPDPQQPRKHFSGLNELAESLRTDGLIEPILVRPVSGLYVIVHGERRFRASKIAGMTEIQAIVRQLTDEAAYRISAIENIQRSNLTAVEEANVYKRFIDQGMTQTAVGKIFGKSQGDVSHKLQLLELPEWLTLYVAQGELSERHVRLVMELKSFYGEGLLRDCQQLPYQLTWEGQTAYEKTGALFYATRPLKVWLESSYRDEPNEDGSEGRLVFTGETAELHSWLDFLARTEQFKPVVSEAADLFASYVLGHNGTIPQWQVAAFWWLSMAAQLDMSVGALKRTMGHSEAWIDYAQYMWRFVSEKVADYEAAPEESVTDAAGKSVTEAYKAQIASYWQYLNVFEYNGMLDDMQLSPAALARETCDWLLNAFRCFIRPLDHNDSNGVTASSLLYERAIYDLYQHHEEFKQWADAGEARRKACAEERGYDCWDCEFVHGNRCTVDEDAENNDTE